MSHHITGQEVGVPQQLYLLLHQGEDEGDRLGGQVAAGTQGRLPG